MNMIRRFPILGAVLAQGLAVGLVLALILLLRPLLPAGGWWPWAAVGGQALVAAGVTVLLRLPVWWVWIALLFPAALGLGLTFGSLPAWPFGLAFVLLYLFYSNTARERVPLYLTNGVTAAALADLARERGVRHAIDLGSGFGDVVRALSGKERRATGVETAPMAFLVSKALSRLTGRGTILRQDLWATDLSEADLVYAFLSPEPMPRLFAKAKAEMKPGSLLVSNSFAVPDVPPDAVWELPDRRRTQLFLYEMGAQQHDTQDEVLSPDSGRPPT